MPILEEIELTKPLSVTMAERITIPSAIGRKDRAVFAGMSRDSKRVVPPKSRGQLEALSSRLIVFVLVTHTLGGGLGHELLELLANQRHLRTDLELDVVGAAASHWGRS